MQRGLFAIGVLVLGCLASCSSFENPPSTSSTPSVDPSVAGRGSLLVNDLIGCADCHTSDPAKPFGGGVQFPIDQAGHYVYSRNLTPDANTGLKLTQDQFITMMQTGEDFTNHGQVLLVMPWPNFRWMSTDDLKAIYAFLQLLPAANNQVPPDNKGIYVAQGPIPLPSEYNECEETRPLPPANSPDPLGPPGESTETPDPGNAVRGAAIVPLAYAKMPNFYKRTAEEQASFGRGAYLVNAGACNDCHTNKGGQSRSLTPGPTLLQIPVDSYLIGGATFSDPSSLQTLLKQTRSMSQNLIGKTGGWFNDPTHTYLTFLSEIDAMAHTDDNPPLSMGWPMPANHLRNLPDPDLQDIYTYLKILASDYVSATQLDKHTQDPARYCTKGSDCLSGQTCWVDSSSAKTVGNQCLTTSCMTDADCDACQHCTGNTCVAPSASDTCLTQGI